MQENKRMEKTKEIEKLLPGFNCGACGYSDCHRFSVAVNNDKISVNNCTVLQQERFKNQLLALQKITENNSSFSAEKQITGLIDGVKADFALHPLNGEPSCRETLMCLAPVPLKTGMTVRYRPLGCPITHFARIVEINGGLPDVWITGPGKLLGREEDVTDLGICLILSFQGIIEGELPKVGQTVKFLPAHCMMGKIHSGVVVQLEDNMTRIDGIDLKVWQHAEHIS